LFTDEIPVKPLILDIVERAFLLFDI
jgi:hypothetical protein